MEDYLALPDLGNPGIWFSLLTLAALEIVLGIDNIIFISLLTNRLPVEQQPKARTWGLTLALVFRLALLFSITWIITLKNPVFHISFWPDDTGAPMGISVKDIILIVGGIFLIAKSTTELFHKTERHQDPSQPRARVLFSTMLLQIILIDMVFSLDSILTAVGLVESVWIMVAAVVVSMIVMLIFAGTISRFINRHPSLQVLALAFLILIGVLLVAEGFEQGFNKGYVYFGMAFALSVELINMRMRQKQPVEH